MALIEIGGHVLAMEDRGDGTFDQPKLAKRAGKAPPTAIVRQPCTTWGFALPRPACGGDRQAQRGSVIAEAGHIERREGVRFGQRFRHGRDADAQSLGHRGEAHLELVGVFEKEGAEDVGVAGGQGIDLNRRATLQQALSLGLDKGFRGSRKSRNEEGDRRRRRHGAASKHAPRVKSRTWQENGRGCGDHWEHSPAQHGDPWAKDYATIRAPTARTGKATIRNRTAAAATWAALRASGVPF